MLAQMLVPAVQSLFLGECSWRGLYFWGETVKPQQRLALAMAALVAGRVRGRLAKRAMNSSRLIPKNNGLFRRSSPIQLTCRPNYSDQLRNAKTVSEFAKVILPEIKSIKKDGAKFYEEGIYISPKSIFSFIAYLRKMSQIKGCNFSCYKSALEKINGFNEDYVLPAIGEDIDLTWRFEGMGYHLYSLRNFAVQYHLYHKENWSDQSVNEAIMKENQRLKRYVTLNGLKKLEEN